MNKMNEKLSEKNLLSSWQEKISNAEKKYADYYRLVKKTREFYKDARTGSEHLKSGHYNLFWSSIETLKPFLYFKQPTVHIERQNKTSSPAQKMACRILEKALNWSLAQTDFDSTVKYARNDFLISGAGILWEHYEPQFETLGEDMEMKIGENVVSQYVDPTCFLADCDNVGIWEDVSWIARKTYMSPKEIKDMFGKEALSALALLSSKEDKKNLCVYEVWDKNEKKVYWFEKNSSKFLKISEDPLHLKGFFPCPKPLFATLTNDSIIPVPDYTLIRELLDELNGVNQRMKMITQAFKISGAYDSSFPDLVNILEKENTLVAVQDFIKLKENGGLRGIVDFMPLEQYVTALSQLAERRQDIMNQIYEITGVSDIMRGNSNAAETATAITKKTNFGTLRNQDRQNEMQRFIRDLYRIKAEMIAEMFDAGFLIDLLSPEEKQNMELVHQGITLLKEEKIRGMLFSVETDNIINRNEEAEQASSAIQSINTIIQSAFQVVSSQPLLLPLYRSMVEVLTQYLPKAKPFEPVLENVFSSIEQDLNKPEPAPVQQAPQPNFAVLLEQERMKNNFLIEKEKNALKSRELDIKEESERQKNFLTEKEMALQTLLKTEELKKKTDKSLESSEDLSNVTTGYVKGF